MKNFPSAMTRQVAAALGEMHEATVDGLRAKFPDKTRKQISRSLQAALALGLVRRKQPGRPGRQRTQAVWEVDEPDCKNVFIAGGYVSVWAYAQARSAP